MVSSTASVIICSTTLSSLTAKYRETDLGALNVKSYPARRLENFALLHRPGLWIYRGLPGFVDNILEPGLIHSGGQPLSVSSRPSIVSQRYEILPLDVSF